ncbi:MAG: MarR family transcriptional regulator [Spirochaetia bacterium]|nr:MAG: MarR family transcriptional regulator [Spirochaetia bacterium]
MFLREVEADPEAVATDFLNEDRDLQVTQLMVSVSKTVRALLGIKLAEIGLNNGQDEAMLALDEANPISVAMLAEKLSVRPPTVSKMLDRLVAKNLVDRVNDTNDARKTMVKITPTGLETQDRIRAVWAQVGADLSEFAKAEDSQVLMRELSGLQKHLTKRLTQLR